MIEVRLFATFRENRDKIVYLEPIGIETTADVAEKLGIDYNEISIFLVNGFHSNPETKVSDGDILALFPPVGGG